MKVQNKQAQARKENKKTKEGYSSTTIIKMNSNTIKKQ